MFDMGMSVKAFVILLLGGAGTVFGPVVGAFVVELLANLTWSKLLNWHLGAMGLIIIGVILLFPGRLRRRDAAAGPDRATPAHAARTSRGRGFGRSMIPAGADRPCWPFNCRSRPSADPTRTP